MTSIHKALAELELHSESAALCTVVSSQGSTPRHVGSKMLVYPDGRFIGTVGGGELEHRVLEEASLAIADEQPRTLTYTLAEPARGDPGVCGGTVEVFVEPIIPSATIVVIGGGHVGKAVVHLAKWLGFRVVLSDDRVDFCNPDAVPGADQYLTIPMGELPAHVNIGPHSYLVLTTRGSNIDVAGLAPLLECPAAYIGVIGSKRRWATTVRELRRQGVTEGRIAQVHSPMGLELNAETPEEIALSIMAEVLQLRDKGSGKPMKE